MLKKIQVNLQRNSLYYIVFFTGAGVLIIEVIATRILAPYFGSTVYSVSSILGIILAALSFGYYYGGILADKNLFRKNFYIIIAAAGISVLFLQLINLTFLS